MGSLTWLFPMSATHIHSGLPPFPTTTKQKSVLCNLQVRSHKTAFSFSDLACILFLRHVVFGWGVRRVVDMNWHDPGLILKVTSSASIVTDLCILLGQLCQQGLLCCSLYYCCCPYGKKKKVVPLYCRSHSCYGKSDVCFW